MKIAMVFDGLGFGGIERVGLHYVRLLRQKGHEIDIYNVKPAFYEMEQEYPQDINIYHVNITDLMMPDYYMLMVKRWRWGKYLYPLAYLGTSALMYIKRLAQGRRKSYDIAIAFSGHFRDLTFVANNFIKADKKLCWLHGALLEYMASSCTYGDLYRKIKNLCVLSEDRQEYALSVNAYLNELNINHIYNPIPDEKGEPDEALMRELERDMGDYILMVGRFECDKDQKTVIRAKKILSEKYGRNNKLVFVGGGGSLLEECKAYAKELGLENEIVFFGPRYDVWNFYTTAGLFVHSSPAEGLPTVLLEAMKYGVPIVATDSPPGVTEILQNDTYGIRCRIGDAGDMAQKIDRLLGDEELYRHYTRMGAERIKDFTYATIGDKLDKIFEELR